MRERQRSRDKDRREKRDTSRDRRRRDDSTDSKRSSRRRDGGERISSRTSTEKNSVLLPQGILWHHLTILQNSKPSSSSISEEEKKKVERLARLEAWKQKQKATEQQKDLQSAAGTRGLLDEIDKKAAASPAAVLSPQSPATFTEATSPTPYAGKFDPKAITKKTRATGASAAATKLGTDISLPEQSKSSATLNSSHGSKANPFSAPAKPSSSMFKSFPHYDHFSNSDTLLAQSSVPLKARGNVSGFGLANKQEQDKPATKRGLDFEEEEGSRKKLEKLPTPPLENGILDEDAMLTNGTKDEEEDDDDVNMEDGTEEEAAAAARAAAEKREERLQAQSLAYQAGEPADVTTNGVSGEEDTAVVDVKDAAIAVEPEVEEEEEEVDPLDAFMTDLTDNPTTTTLKPRQTLQKKPTQAPEAMFGDDEVDLSAVVENEDILALASSKRKKKDIGTTDHGKIAYEPFPKSFYIEPSDLKELADDDVIELRAQLDNIKVRGTDVPKPAVKWSHCGLTNPLQDVISALNYEKPSSIQAQAIPAIMSGRDIIGVAKTGSGKTAAFIIPMFRHIKAQRDLRKMEGPIALIMTPTRELATQILKDCKPFLKALDLRGICAFGGAPIKDQIGKSLFL